VSNLPLSCALEAAISPTIPLDLHGGDPPVTSQPLTSFVGRVSDLAASREEPRKPTVTLTGPGGVGKTVKDPRRRGCPTVPGGVWLSTSRCATAAWWLTRLPPLGRRVTRRCRCRAARRTHAPSCSSSTTVSTCRPVSRARHPPAAACPNARCSHDRRAIGVEGLIRGPVAAPLRRGGAVDRALGRVGPRAAAAGSHEICALPTPAARHRARGQSAAVLGLGEVAARVQDQRFHRSLIDLLTEATHLNDMVAWSHDLPRPTPSGVRFPGVFALSFTLEAAEAVVVRCTSTSRRCLITVARASGVSTVPSHRFRMLETPRLFALDRLYERGRTPMRPAQPRRVLPADGEIGGQRLLGPDERRAIALEAEEPNQTARSAGPRQRPRDGPAPGGRQGPTGIPGRAQGRCHFDGC
jgi:hypothetical protein